MTVSAQNHGNQPPSSNALMSAPTTDHDSMETLPIHTTTDNTLVAGKDKMSDVLHVQVVCCTTNNGTHACTKVSTKPKRVHQFPQKDLNFKHLPNHSHTQKK